MRGISVAARKSKGRKLQQLVRDTILDKFNHLTEDDVRSTAMGQGGMDVQLSPLAGQSFPYATECKRNKAFAVYNPYDQASTNAGKYEPLLIIQGDRKKPLAIVDFYHFMELVKNVRQTTEETFSEKKSDG
jgi:hypothetical protein